MIFDVKIKKISEKAIIPTYGSPFSAGADLYACLESPCEIKPGETAFIHTGLCAELPEGYVGLVFARSGLACKKDLAPANKVGVIDSDYRGEICVGVINQISEAYEIQPFERVAQMIIKPVELPELTEVSDLDETSRGAGGFGSTGTK